MKQLTLASVLLLVSTVTSGQPAPAAHNWTGVWHVQETDKPGVVITLADDGGALAGTIVFDVWQRQSNEHLATEPRILVNPHLEGNTLAFQVRRILKPHLKGDPSGLEDASSDTDIAKMTLVPTTDGKATLTCLNCGGNAPTELVKQQ